MNENDIRKKQEEVSDDLLMKAELEKREVITASLENSNATQSEKVDPSKREMPVNPNLKESETSSLGRVDMKPLTNRKSTNIGEESLNEQSFKTKGIEIKIERLPTKGMFYPANTKIFIKSATVAEIKDFSLMDETNPLDVNDKLNNILSFCTTVEYGVRKGNYKDIVEEDKMFIILSIKELTFPQGENKLNLKSLCHNCEYENTFELRTENLKYFEEDEKIATYYDAINRVYVIKTKDFGNIILSSPKIGVMQEITNYAKSKQEKKQKWDRAAIQILPYLNMDWRGLNEKYIFDRLVEMESWNEKKFSLILRLTDKLRSGVKQTLTYSCKRCHENLEVDANIEGGMKSLFIRPLEGLLEEELL